MQWQWLILNLTEKASWFQMLTEKASWLWMLAELKASWTGFQC